jgi:hypothetical protein
MRATLLLVLLTVSFIAAAPHRRTSALDTVKNAIKAKILPLVQGKAGEVMNCIKSKAKDALKGLVISKVKALFGGRRLSLKDKALKLACKLGKGPAVAFCRTTLVSGIVKKAEPKIKALLTSYKVPSSAVGPAIECVAITAKKACADAAAAVCK